MFFLKRVLFKTDAKWETSKLQVLNQFYCSLFLSKEAYPTPTEWTAQLLMVFRLLKAQNDALRIDAKNLLIFILFFFKFKEHSGGKGRSGKTSTGMYCSILVMLGKMWATPRCSVGIQYTEAVPISNAPLFQLFVFNEKQTSISSWSFIAGRLRCIRTHHCSLQVNSGGLNRNTEIWPCSLTFSTFHICKFVWNRF